MILSLERIKIWWGDGRFFLVVVEGGVGELSRYLGTGGTPPIPPSNIVHLIYFILMLITEKSFLVTTISFW